MKPNYVIRTAKNSPQLWGENESDRKYNKLSLSAILYRLEQTVSHQLLGLLTFLITHYFATQKYENNVQQ